MYSKEIQKMTGKLNLYNTVLENSYGRFEFYWLRDACSQNENLITQPHCHSHIEIHYTICGCAVFADENNNEFVVPKGKLVLIPANILHTTKAASGDYEKLVMGFSVSDGNEKTKLALDALKRIAVYDGNSTVEPLILSMMRMTENGSSHFAVESGVQTLLCVLAEIVCPKIFQDKVKTELRDESVILRLAENYIHDNIAGASDCESVSRYISLSSRQLSRIAKKYRGVSLGKLISDIRLCEIKHLLSETDMTTAEISERCGFASEFSLMRFFGKEEGTTTRLFREACRK